MRKITTIFFAFCFLITTTKCSKSTPKNEVPSNFDLVFPSKDLLCIDNIITFNWNDAIDPEEDEIEYNIIISRDRQLTDIVENRTVNTSQVTITLEKGIAYYWQVNALDVANEQGTASEVFAFYTKGEAVSNYAPFMAELKSPEDNDIISPGSVNLSWEASDIDDTDVLSYEVLFGEGANLNVVESNLTSKNYSVTVATGNSYSWQINVTDSAGAKSIGQVWTFTVN